MVSNYFVKLFILHRLLKNRCGLTVDAFNHTYTKLKQLLRRNELKMVKKMMKIHFNKFVVLYTCEKYKCQIDAIFNTVTMLYPNEYQQLLYYANGSNNKNKQKNNKRTNIDGITTTTTTNIHKTKCDNPNILKKIFNYCTLTQYIFQFVSCNVQSLSALSLVDSIWFINSFNSICAKCLELHLGKLFLNAVPYWTLQRFDNGVRNLLVCVSHNDLLNAMSTRNNAHKVVLDLVKIYANSHKITINIDALEHNLIHQLLFYESSSSLSLSSTHIQNFSKAKVFHFTLTRSINARNPQRYIRKDIMHAREKMYCISLPAASEVIWNAENCKKFSIVFSACKTLKIKNQIVLDAADHSDNLSTVENLTMNNVIVDFYDPPPNIDEDIDDNNDLKCDYVCDQLMEKEAKWIMLNEIGWSFANIKTICISEPTIDALIILASICRYCHKLDLLNVELSFTAPNMHVFSLADMEKRFDFLKFVESNNIVVTTLKVLIDEDKDILTLQKMAQIYQFNHHLKHLKLKLGILATFMPEPEQEQQWGQEQEQERAADNEAKNQSKEEPGKQCDFLDDSSTVFGFDNIEKLTVSGSWVSAEWVNLYLLKMNLLTLQQKNSNIPPITCFFNFCIRFSKKEFDAVDNDDTLIDNEQFQFCAIDVRILQKLYNVMHQVLSITMTSLENQCKFQLRTSFNYWYVNDDDSDEVYHQCNELCCKLKEEFHSNEIDLQCSLVTECQECIIQLTCLH